MGTPRDEFAWAQVQELDNGIWKCMYCSEEYRGSASSIRNHLSGQGTDISDCPSAPESIRNQALNQITKKRSLDIASSSQDPPSNVTVTEENVLDSFLKLLMSNGSSSPSIIDFIRRSIYGITQDIYQHTLMVQETWKTSGCTVMVFSRPVHDAEKCIIGFYCPKGVIFVETPHPDIDFRGFRAALSRNSPSLDFDDSITYTILRHNVNSRGGSSNDWTRRVEDECSIKLHLCRCLRDEIEEICIDSCGNSAWAEGMIENAVELHNQLCSNETLRLGYYEIIEKDGESFKDFDNKKGMPALRLSILLSIMRQNFGLRQKLLNYIERNSLGDDVVEALDVIFLDSDEYDATEFWDQGRKLQIILTCILRVLDLMDTSVPTSGILAMALERVEDKLCIRTEPILEEGEESYTFWRELEPKIRGSVEDNCVRDAAMYMNPLFCTRLLSKHGDEVQRKVQKALIKYVYGDLVYAGEHDGEMEDLVREVQSYGNVFRNMFVGDKKLYKHNYHPLKLWEEEGHELPLLRKHAITLLSQPLNCMRKQVKKHLHELNGEDDYVLRLNVRMMHDFKLLSDDICTPVHILYGGWL